MNDTIHVFSHHAMATYFQVRIAGQDRGYAAQAARVAFDLLDHLEALLSRFRENSEISQIGLLTPGDQLRLTEPTFACLEIAQKMEAATGSAFCVSPAALKKQTELPVWSLHRSEFSIRCDDGRLDFDLGAIGKGFALDRMAAELADWDCSSFLLVAGGSSILAGNSPPGLPGWSAGLGDDDSDQRFWLSDCSLSGSGLAVKGDHILDPRTGRPVKKHSRIWAIASSAAESDALSTACMVWTEAEMARCLAERKDWLVFLHDGQQWRHYGERKVPPVDESRAGNLQKPG
jgi:thiamine biosynthesis lipoprotein